MLNNYATSVTIYKIQNNNNKIIIYTIFLHFRGQLYQKYTGSYNADLVYCYYYLFSLSRVACFSSKAVLTQGPAAYNYIYILKNIRIILNRHVKIIKGVKYRKIYILFYIKTKQNTVHN